MIAPGWGGECWRLLEAGAYLDVVGVGEGGEGGFAVFAGGGGEEHAVRFEAAHFAGGEVGDDDDLAADEVFGGVPLGDAGEDLAAAHSGFGAEVDFEAEEFVGFGDAFGDEDPGDAEFDFGEVVDGDLGGGLGVCGGAGEDGLRQSGTAFGGAGCGPAEAGPFWWAGGGGPFGGGGGGGRDWGLALAGW